MDFTIPADLELIIGTVRDYVDRALLPREMEIEHQERIALRAAFLFGFAQQVMSRYRA